MAEHRQPPDLAAAAERLRSWLDDVIAAASAAAATDTPADVTARAGSGSGSGFGSGSGGLASRDAFEGGESGLGVLEAWHQVHGAHVIAAALALEALAVEVAARDPEAPSPPLP